MSTRSSRYGWLSALALLATACGGDPADTVRKTIGPAGGLVSSHDNVLSLVFQPGALNREREIVIFPSDEPPTVFGAAYRVMPDIELLVDVQVSYSRALPDDPSGVAVSAITLDDYGDEMGHWTPLPRLSVNEEAGVVLGSDSQLSLYYSLNEYTVVSTSSGNSTDDPPGDTDPGDTDPGDTDPGDTDPGDTDPGDTDPSGGPGCSNGTVDPGEMCFNSADFDMDGGPVDVTLADVNNDNNLDVATANANGSFSLRLGDGSGGFGAESNEATPGEPSAIAGGDLDNMNGADLVVPLSSTNQMLLLQSQGDGTFAQIPIALNGMAPSEVILADANADGGPDILIANAGSGNVSFFSFAGGTLAPEALYVADPVATPMGMSFGQYNSNTDNNGDVFVFGGGVMSVLPGNGNNFANAPLNAAVGTDLRRAVGGDFGGAPGQDAAVTDFAMGGIHILMGNGDPLGFASMDFIATGDGAVDVAAGDVNGDSDIDFIVANSGTDTVTVLLSVGNASWGDATDFDVGSQPTGVDTGDINGDGIDDIVVSYGAGNGITVLTSDP